MMDSAEEGSITPTQMTIWHESTWADDDSDGDAAHSGDEKSSCTTTTTPTHFQTGMTSPSTHSALPSLSDPYADTDEKDGLYLINVDLQIIAGQEHMDTLFQRTKDLLQYIQLADPMAEFLSQTTLPNGSPHPPLKSPLDKHWPTTFVAAQNWIHTSM